jgi:hypothetical protein
MVMDHIAGEELEDGWVRDARLKTARLKRRGRVGRVGRIGRVGRGVVEGWIEGAETEEGSLDGGDVIIGNRELVLDGGVFRIGGGDG